MKHRKTATLDLMNPPETFIDGHRMFDYSLSNCLPMSGRRLPQFHRRRNIKEMFIRAPILGDLPPQLPTFDNFEMPTKDEVESLQSSKGEIGQDTLPQRPIAPAIPHTKSPVKPGVKATVKRAASPVPAPAPSSKRGKASLKNSQSQSKSQKSLTGFFKPMSSAEKSPTKEQEKPSPRRSSSGVINAEDFDNPEDLATSPERRPSEGITVSTGSLKSSPPPSQPSETISPFIDSTESTFPFINSSETTESWNALFRRRGPPLCNYHREPCLSFQTKKTGMNYGRMFWVCPRPVGPKGKEENGTEWKCSTFIWSSDHKRDAAVD